MFIPLFANFRIYILTCLPLAHLRCLLSSNDIDNMNGVSGIENGESIGFFIMFKINVLLLSAVLGMIFHRAGKPEKCWHPSFKCIHERQQLIPVFNISVNMPIRLPSFARST